MENHSAIIKGKPFEKYVEAITADDILAAKAILLDCINDETVIYKYAQGRVQDFYTVTKGRLWLCNATKFNDPYDSAFLVNKRSKEVYPFGEFERAKSEYDKQLIANEKSLKMQNSVFVASFSEKGNYNPMWGYYAYGHKGICWGYNLKELIEKYDCLPVIYNDSIPIFDPEVFTYYGALSKSFEWSHECEWRILKNDLTYTGKDGFEIDFIYPNEVCIGSRRHLAEKENHEIINSPERDKRFVTKAEILSFAEQHKLDLYSSRVDEKKYSLFKSRWLLEWQMRNNFRDK